MTEALTIEHPTESEYAFEFTLGERRVFAPKEDLTVSQHAERYRVVTKGPRQGQWTNRLTPYLQAPMDAFTLPWVRKIFLCFAPQTGKTQIAFNCLTYLIDQDPDTVMYVMSDEQRAKRIASRQIIPMLKDSPRTADLLSDNADDTSTLAVRFRNGMDLMMAWATSAAALASESVRYLFFDEIDKYQYPISLDLGDQRTNAYPYTKKILYFTTPEEEERPITQLIRTEADVLYLYQARCPVCGHLQVMTFENIVWPADIRDPKKITRRKLALYSCEKCKMGWHDGMRDLAVRAGAWVPFIGKNIFGEFDTPPERPAAVAFHFPSWPSPFISLSDVAAAFLRGKKDPEKHRIFVTQHKAEPWKQVITTSTEEAVLAARLPELPPQTVPASAYVLTLFADRQKYGNWFSVRAWDRDYNSWLIHYGLIPTLEDLEQLIWSAEYPIENSADRMRVWRAGVDIGGGKYNDVSSTSTEETYLWLVSMRRKHAGGCRVYAMKGASRPLAGKISVGKPIDKTPTGKPIPGGLQIISVDTGKLKDLFHARLERAASRESMAAYLHRDTDVAYAKQILAEEKRKPRRGIEEWVQIRRDNHYLDCEVGCHALADKEWPGGGVHLLSEPYIIRTEETVRFEHETAPAGDRSRPAWFNNRTRR